MREQDDIYMVGTVKASIYTVTARLGSYVPRSYPYTIVLYRSGLWPERYDSVIVSYPGISYNYGNTTDITLAVNLPGDYYYWCITGFMFGSVSLK